MRSKSKMIGIAAIAVVVASAWAVSAAQDRFALKVPGGLAFAEFKGYENWQTISVSHSGDVIAVILGNPAMIAAYKEGIPGNGKPFPDGAKMAKVHWEAKKNPAQPGQPIQAGELQDIDLMVKDSKRFPDSGGWGYGAFDYVKNSDSFRPADESDTPPQSHDAKCGAACHTAARQQDFVFTGYPKR